MTREERDALIDLRNAMEDCLECCPEHFAVLAKLLTRRLSSPASGVAREARASVALDGETQHCEACFDEIVVMGPGRIGPSALPHTCGREPPAGVSGRPSTVERDPKLPTNSASGVQAEGARGTSGARIQDGLPCPGTGKEGADGS